MERLVLVRLDANYCNYLRKIDNIVPYNYNEKELRPYVGVLFKVKDFYYYSPLTRYCKLLRKQLYWINRNDSQVRNRAISMYQKYINNKLSPNMRKRCCNFKLLEEKCLEYNKNIVKETVNN